MTELSSVMSGFSGAALCLISLFLVIGQLRAVYRLSGSGRKGMFALSACNLIFGFMLFTMLMDFARYTEKPEMHGALLAFQKSLYHMPWLICAAAEAASAVILGICLIAAARHRSSHLSADDIREAINRMPEGIAVSATDGTVLLSNLKMNELNRLLTGRALYNIGRLWQTVTEGGEEQSGRYLIPTAKGSVWMFAREPLLIGEREYSRLTASDVTERYRIIEELRRNNAHLLELRSRMKAVTDLSGDMFIAQEESAARVALHNQLGQVLLMCRHYFEHEQDSDPVMVYMTTRQMNLFLLGEAEEPIREQGDDLQQALSMTQSIHVKAELTGGVPQNETARGILAMAIRECAANTVKHAEGDTLYADIQRKGSDFVFTLKNNGKAPKDVVTESGGLLSLRKSVEAAGGEMRIESLPHFILTIRIHSNG
ncbi:MAG: hypothetical protein IJH07_01500 [Ruminococcus sp.]|nr:hypothetical protein [Ruminococcus sp.]